MAGLPESKLLGQGVTQVIVSETEAGQRIDNFLLRRWKGVPKSKIYQLIRKGQVRQEKKRVKPQTRLTLGAQLRLPPIHLPSQSPSVLVPQSVATSVANTLGSRILFEDDGLLVVNKPAGLAVHGGSGIQLGAIEAIRGMYPEQKGLELVHRLDRETSGCLMVAKKRAVLRLLHEGFRDRLITKRYVVLVHGVWPKRKTVIQEPLFRFVAKNGERFVKADVERGVSARTEFSVLERFGEATLLEARPITGRTHQIRVHAAFVGCPIVGDRKYGNDQLTHKPSWARALGGRHFLHCKALDCSALIDGAGDEAASMPVYCFDAPLDEALDSVLNKLRQSM